MNQSKHRKPPKSTFYRAALRSRCPSSPGSYRLSLLSARKTQSPSRRMELLNLQIERFFARTKNKHDELNLVDPEVTDYLALGFLCIQELSQIHSIGNN